MLATIAFDLGQLRTADLDDKGQRKGHVAASDLLLRDMHRPAMVW
jgi:hypothetical protein